MTRFWLVRHGETDWNLQGRYQGQADPPLNANGLTQAQRIGDQLIDEGIKAIFSSDLQRALHTAQIIADKLQLSVFIDKRLREISLGKWEGMLIDDIIAQFPLEWQSRQDNPVQAHAPGGENLLQVAERVRDAAEQIAQDYPSESVIIVSHGMALATLFSLAQDLPLGQAYTLIPDNAHPLRVDWS
jgi:broad specificity phosphatase PhoE